MNQFLSSVILGGFLVSVLVCTKANADQLPVSAIDQLLVDCGIDKADLNQKIFNGAGNETFLFNMQTFESLLFKDYNACTKAIELLDLNAIDQSKLAENERIILRVLGVFLSGSTLQYVGDWTEDGQLDDPPFSQTLPSFCSTENITLEEINKIGIALYMMIISEDTMNPIYFQVTSQIYDLITLQGYTLKDFLLSSELASQRYRGLGTILNHNMLNAIPCP